MTALGGKIAIISGGTSGIGAATARLFQAEGAIVVATGSSSKSVTKARGDGRHRTVVSDAGDAAVAEVLVAQIRSAHGRVDVLFANASTTASPRSVAWTRERSIDS